MIIITSFIIIGCSDFARSVQSSVAAICSTIVG